MAVAVWDDPNDARTTVNVAKKARLRKLRTTEGDAELDGGAYAMRARSQHQHINQRTVWAGAYSRPLLSSI